MSVSLSVFVSVSVFLSPQWLCIYNIYICMCMCCRLPGDLDSCLIISYPHPFLHSCWFCSPRLLLTRHIMLCAVHLHSLPLMVTGCSTVQQHGETAARATTGACSSYAFVAKEKEQVVPYLPCSSVASEARKHPNIPPLHHTRSARMSAPERITAMVCRLCIYLAECSIISNYPHDC